MPTFVKLNISGENKPTWALETKTTKLGPKDLFDIEAYTGGAIVTVEAAGFEHLCWLDTVLDDPTARYGWLTPEGKFHGCSCDRIEHQLKLLFKKSLHALLAEGFIQIKPHMFNSKGKPSSEQLNWLLFKGYDVTRYLPKEQQSVTAIDKLFGEREDVLEAIEKEEARKAKEEAQRKAKEKEQLLQLRQQTACMPENV